MAVVDRGDRVLALALDLALALRFLARLALLKLRIPPLLPL